MAGWREATARITHGVLRGAFLLALIALGSLFVVQIALIAARSVLAVTFAWLPELATALLAATIVFATGWTVSQGRHVAVDVWSSRWTNGQRRWRDRAGFFLLALPMAGTIGWTAWPYIAQAWAFREGSAELSGLPGLFLVKSLLGIFAGLLVLGAMALALRRSP